jgi:hypothetical protein
MLKLRSNVPVVAVGICSPYYPPAFGGSLLIRPSDCRLVVNICAVIRFLMNAGTIEVSDVGYSYSS